MTSWIRWIRAALGMGLTWAVGWGLVGGMIEALSNIAPGLQWPYVIDMWPQTLAIPGFFCGAAFSVALRLAAGRRREFGEVSIPRFAALGALAGGTLGLITGAPIVILTALTLMSAASAAGTLAIARASTRAALPHPGAPQPPA